MFSVPSLLGGRRSGPVNFPVSRVNIAAILHAKSALGLTLSWFPSSAEKKNSSSVILRKIVKFNKNWQT